MAPLGKIYVSAKVGLNDPKAIYFLLQLKTSGVRVYWPPKFPGEEAMREQMGQCGALLVLLDEEWADSLDRQSELRCAIKCGALPVLGYPASEAARKGLLSWPDGFEVLEAKHGAALEGVRTVLEKSSQDTLKAVNSGHA